MFEQSERTRAERHSNSHLAFARCRAREQHRREIRARDQQDEKNSAEQNEQRWTHPAHRQIVQRQHIAAEAIVLHVVIRMLAAHLRVNRLDLSLRLRD